MTEKNIKMTISLKIQLLAVVIAAAVALVVNADEDCESNRLVVYKVIFTTYWDRKRFPKQYPEWRPPAQWSKLVGKWYLFYICILLICIRQNIILPDNCLTPSYLKTMVKFPQNMQKIDTYILSIFFYVCILVSNWHVRSKLLTEYSCK